MLCEMMICVSENAIEIIHTFKEKNSVQICLWLITLLTLALILFMCVSRHMFVCILQVSSEQPWQTWIERQENITQW